MDKTDLKILCNKLRNETNCGLMDCKKALFKFNFNYKKAKDWLTEGGHLKNRIV